MALHKILKYIMILLSIIGVMFLLIILFGNTGVISSFLTLGYITLAIAIFFTLLFIGTNIFANKENLKRAFVSFGIFIAIVVISFAISSGEPVMKSGVQIVSESGARWIDAGLKAFYILAVLSLLTIVFSGFKKLTK